MPDTIDHGLAPWLIEIIAELGVARSGMSGLVGLDYGEIESYERFAGIKLGRAAIMIRKISASYATGYNQGQDDCEALIGFNLSIIQPNKAAHPRSRNAQFCDYFDQPWR